MNLVRFIPLLVPVLTYIFSEIINFWPKAIYVVLASAIVLFSFASAALIKRSGNKNKWWNIFILPMYFYVGVMLFVTIIPSKFIVQLLFLLNLFFQYFYFRTVYNYLIKIEDYQNYSLENISSYGNFLGIYFMSSAIYGLQSFLNTPVWLVMLAMLLVVGLAIYQVFWTNGIGFNDGFFYILILCLVLIEIAWTATFLPSSFYILGLLFSICYYMLIGLTRFYLLEKLDKRIVKLYLIYGFSSILLVLLTARWM
jgi:hypothetical protein